MGQIFQNFIAGNQAGREEGEARRRQNALEQAGSAYGAGDTATVGGRFHRDCDRR